MTTTTRTMRDMQKSITTTMTRDDNKDEGKGRVMIRRTTRDERVRVRQS
jgi:hypothetical protein